MFGRTAGTEGNEHGHSSSFEDVKRPILLSVFGKGTAKLEKILY
jgi:hypothetical protein